MNKETKDEMFKLCDEQDEILCILKNKFELRKDQTEEVLKRISIAMLSLDGVTNAIRGISESSELS